MSNAIVRSTGIETLGSGLSVLGERQTRIPTGGKIRSGIKVLTNAARSHAKAQEIYNAGMAAGLPFGEIEKRLVDQCKFQKSPLTPKNVPYFTVRRHDFIIPEAADAIMKLYGTDGPDGFHLYRLPVIFPLDAWNAVMPHGLHYYTRSQLVYWSEYAADGKRHCMMRAPVAIDEKAKRAMRPFGGRAIVPRAENEGLCDPNKCPEYQNRLCTLTGSLLFYVPGIPGTSAIELPTRSFYSMQQARQKLEMVAYLRGGKISGTLDGKPIFYLTKKQHEVSMIDDEGKTKKVKQWLIELEADIDMTRMFQMSESRPLLEAGNAAVAALEAPAVEAADVDDAADDIPPPTPEPIPPPPTGDIDAIKAARKEVNEGLGILGIDTMHFSKYGTAKYGEHWSKSLDGLDKAKKELSTAADDPAALAAIKNWTGA